MAKTNQRMPQTPAKHALGQTREEMIRELGLEGLTREACLRGLFEDLLDQPDQGDDGITVTQVGPGRRSPK